MNGSNAADLVDDQQHRALLGQQLEDCAIRCATALCLDDTQNDIDLGQSLRHVAIHCTIQRAAMTRLKTGRIDKDKLSCFRRQDAGDPMAGRLRLLRGNTDLLADQLVQQRRLAHIGTPHNRQRATTKILFHILLRHRIDFPPND